jgi:hypothetical protein
MRSTLIEPKNFMPVREYSERTTGIKSYFVSTSREGRDAAAIFSACLPKASEGMVKRSERLHPLERSSKKMHIAAVVPGKVF